MELKRKLDKLAKRMTPHIEVMNVRDEIARSIHRIDELITYAQTKIDRSAERKAKNQQTIGAKADAERKATEQVVFDAQTAESDANLADQKEAFDERNKKAGMENAEETGDSSDNPAVPVGAGDEPDDGAANEVKKPAKKKAKKKASKKK